MKKKYRFILIGVIFLIPIFLIYFINEQNSIEEINNELFHEIYEVKKGYGYKIISDDKVLIKQDFIPAIPGKIPFNSYIEAQMVAQLVIEKILKKEDPKIKKKDIENLEITVKREYP